MWPSGEALACKAGDVGSTPAVVLVDRRACDRKCWPHWRGAPDLKSGRPAMAGRAGSNPAASVWDEKWIGSSDPIGAGYRPRIPAGLQALKVRILHMILHEGG